MTPPPQLQLHPGQDARGTKWGRLWAQDLAFGLLQAAVVYLPFLNGVVVVMPLSGMKAEASALPSTKGTSPISTSAMASYSKPLASTTVSAKEGLSGMRMAGVTLLPPRTSSRTRMVAGVLSAVLSAALAGVLSAFFFAGAPAGVGMGFAPPRWLRGGDVVRIEVDGIGAIENRFEAA